MMKKIGIAAAVLIVLGMLFGGDDDAPEPVAASVPQQPAPAPEPEPEPEHEPEPSEPMRYGDDAELDRLHDLCAEGDIDACDELWWDSPIGSEYETFADERFDELKPPLTDDELASFILEYVWSNASESDNAAICDGVDLLGADAAGHIISSETDSVTAAQAAAFLTKKCE